MSRSQPKRTATRRGAAPKKAPARKPKKPGLIERAVAALPISHETWHRIVTVTIVGSVAAAALGAAVWAGVPAMAGVAASNLVGEAGLKVDAIQIDGIKRMDRMTVYEQALDQDSRAMPLVDLAMVRERLLQHPWVKDARVSRQLPNTLRIYIVEREPAAIWQSHGQLMLVDTTGVPLEPVSREAMPDLPLLIGEGANSQEAARRKLLEAAPALREQVKAATWIGNRRWDLLFKSGERLQLPEGEPESAAALKKFAELEATQRLLGRGHVGFDMRDPEKLVVRRQNVVNPPESGDKGV